jgi:hypothetical protein
MKTKIWTEMNKDFLLAQEEKRKEIEALRAAGKKIPAPVSRIARSSRIADEN